MSIVPISAEGIVAAFAILFGWLPARGTSAAAGAVFPLDVYFDVKQALATTSGWVAFTLVLVASVVIRSGVLVLTLWLGDAPDAKPWKAWAAALRPVGVTALMFLPVALMFFAGTAIRYAPFLWIAGPVGLVIAMLRARRGVNLDVGEGAPRGDATPEAAPFLAYAYVVALSGAAISFIGDISSILAALLVASLGPLHALFLLGWRENARAEVYPGGGFAALAVTVALGGSLAVGTFYDRVVSSPGPVGRTQKAGSLAILGGIDSTSETGALTELDVRTLGYPEQRVKRLSYTSARSYTAVDTHADLDVVAVRVAEQVEALEDLESVVGHSQAALIVDRMLAARVDLPSAVMFAPPPPRPPSLTVPAPGRPGDGRPGADLARGLSALLETLGGPDFDLDGPSSPPHLDAVVPDADVPRLAIWALGDSVWLDGDWRRPGEFNVVAVTDHVGATQNRRALTVARDFLAGRPVAPDIGSWRGILVPVIRYAFEPWRPENR